MVDLADRSALCENREHATASPRLRWPVLLCASLMPLGCHMCYKSTSGLEKYLVGKDGFEPEITHAQYGLLNSAVSWINIVLPFFVGIIIDNRASRVIATLAALCAVVGQTVFSVAVEMKSFSLALLGRYIFGAAESSMMMAQGAILSRWFGNAEMTFAFGICTMTHNLANFLGKISVAFGTGLGDWRMTNWIGVFVCVCGLVFASVYALIESRTEASGRALHHSKQGRLTCSGWRHLTATFWILWFLHMLVSNVEHLFDTYSADFISSKWHAKTTKAAWLSSLNYVTGLVLSPLIGLALDAIGWRMVVGGAACLVMGASHLLLGFTNVTPGVGLVLLSLPESVLPTILKSCVPLVVRPSVVGLSFGVYEVAENLGKIIGSPLVGWIRDATQSYQVDELILVIASICAAVVCLLISWVDRRRGGALNGNPEQRRLYTESIRLQDLTELSESCR